MHILYNQPLPNCSGCHGPGPPRPQEFLCKFGKDTATFGANMSIKIDKKILILACTRGFGALTRPTPNTTVDMIVLYVYAP